MPTNNTFSTVLYSSIAAVSFFVIGRLTASNEPVQITCNPPATMSSADVIKIVSSYKTKRMDILQKHWKEVDSTATLPEGDSRFVTFTKANLTNYICYMDSMMLKNQKTMTGLRFYFGVYPIGLSAGGGFNPNYVGYQTLLVVPTYQDSIGKEWDYLPSNFGNNNNPVYVLNHAGLCPPPPPQGCQSQSVILNSINQ